MGWSGESRGSYSYSSYIATLPTTVIVKPPSRRLDAGRFHGWAYFILRDRLYITKEPATWLCEATFDSSLSLW
jgi:hypothetical protein